MSKEQLLSLMRLLSGLESILIYKMRDTHIPDYLLDKISENVSLIEKEILK